MAHALRLPGAAEELTTALGGEALLRPEDLVHLGVELAQTTEWEQVEQLGLRVVTQDELVGDPTAAAGRALTAIRGGPYVVHVDVDVLDFTDAPLAENVNGRNSGPTVEQLGEALAVLVGREDCRGLSIGQLVPAHAASDPDALDRFVEWLTSALAQVPQ